VEGLEASGEILELEVWGEKKSLKLNKNAQEGEELLDSGAGGRWGKVWLQGNDKATRKQVAPLLVSSSTSASLLLTISEGRSCQACIATLCIKHARVMYYSDIPPCQAETLARRL